MIDAAQLVLRPDSFYASIDITDDKMFATTMGQHPEYITALLKEMLPNEEIGHVTPSGIDPYAGTNYTNVQQAFFPAVYAHGARYDVFHTDGRFLFDVEMHNSGVSDKRIRPIDVARLIKRTRYAHSVMDVTSLRSGEDYINLKKHYVIYICTFDLIGRKGYRYEAIVPWFEGYSDVLFDEDRRTIFYNTKGSEGELSEAMKEILKYIDNPKGYPVSETKVPLIKGIDAAVKFNQQSPEWRRNYEVIAMREHDVAIEARQEGRKEGRQEGRKEGRQEGRKEGRKEGSWEGRKAVALKMLRRERPVEEIMEDTELSAEEIQAMKMNLEGI